MYTTLKTKRYHFQIPQVSESENEDKIDDDDRQKQNEKTSVIVSSCFLDDVFILFLFNTGRYLIVNTSNHLNEKRAQSNLVNKKKKSSTNESQIFYEGNILEQIRQKEFKQSANLNKFDKFIQKEYESPKKLMQKNSLSLMQECASNIFVQCKRIKINECIIITRYSRNVYWLKLIRNSINSIKDINGSIKTQIIELPGTMLSDILPEDNMNILNTMTILTELIQFDNGQGNNSSVQTNGSINVGSNCGSFCIKNQIIEDKMMYLTFYTRVTFNNREKPNSLIQGTNNQLKITSGHSQYYYSQYQFQQNIKHSHHIKPQFIISKTQLPIPINEASSNYIVQVSNKRRNQIAIYKQSQDDQNQWEIRLWRFSLQEINGIQLLHNYFNKQNLSQLEKQNNIAIQNSTYIYKPLTIVLPKQFTSSINLQQLISYDLDLLHSYNSGLISNANLNQQTYLIVSINQTFVEQNNQDEILNHDNNNLLNKCRVHSCKLTFQENSKENFSQWIQKIHTFDLNAISFLKIINIDYNLQLLYVLSLAHQRVDNQLYENKIDLIDMKTGKVVQKGYCSLKNYSFSPNQKYILDVPYTFTAREDYFYHIRYLFDKKTLYLHMIQNSKYFKDYQDVNFIQTVLSLF